MTASLALVTAVCCALLGLCVGSFLNVVVHRVPRGESLLRPASHCPSCDAPVRARHNVPVLGWLVLRGRCADCRAPISARYPLVEAGTAAAFGVVGAVFAGSWVLPALLYLAGAGIALALIDADTSRLPDVIVGSTFVVVLALLVVASAGSDAWSALLRGLVGAAASYAFFLLLAVARPGGMGGGDVKLSAVLGLATAWVGWGALLAGLFVGFALGAVTGVGLMAAGRATRRTPLPFGPFLIAGAFVGVFGGNAVASAYVGLMTGAA